MMLMQIASFLINAIFGFFVFLVLLRFLLQSLRAPFHNPIGQFTIALTDWIVRPLRRVVPPFRQYDLASLASAWLLILVKLLLLMLLIGMEVSLVNLLVTSLFDMVRNLLQLVMLIVIVQVIVSWLNPHHPLSFVLNALTRPFYRLFSFIKPIAGFDLSPLFLLLAINILLIVLHSIQPGSRMMF
jgi:YggT family protein